ncbi:TPA: hypothetical protein ACKQBZ_003507 [Stenotrophomonas maltophilia]|uniref:hypothetical protein n=1 Tax=Stenotrophomonas sp. Sm6012 TaxID=3002745 RepID=UPI00131342E2|nr:hypothetical protein [Stenotrophomonas sp. Sm6012]MBH1365181.1 hypothetical protein [Stenotrophomonas maltophilia]MDQ7281511.1 hypothetical protein [Stenotrophomonas sp. Sm6012]HEL3181500.1 hypothetical protein [Stenotrophomonas maltophilia]
MTPSQAETIASAVMQPDDRRAEIAAQQQAQAQQLKRQRKAAAIGLIGMAAGALIAGQSGLPWVKGLLYGGVPTFFIARIWLDRRALCR